MTGVKAGSTMQQRHREEVEITGFAGVRERVYVMDPARFGSARPDSAMDGMGPLHYLADAFMRPQGSTGLHRHDAVIIVTLVLNGTLAHRGSLGDGQRLHAGDIQVQWSGANGFSHNEVNPGPGYCRFLQLWLTPQQPLSQPGYTVASLAGKGTTTVPLPGTIHGLTLQLHQLAPGERLELPGDALLYLATGGLALIDSPSHVSAETLLRGEDLHLTAVSESLLLSAQQH